MRDPHVEILRYRLETASNITYDNPLPVDIDHDEFSGRLETGILTCHMKKHYESIDAAHKVVTWYLRAWEMDAALKFGPGEIRFVYEDAQVIDRNPPPPDAPLEIQVSEGFLTMEGSVVTLRVTRREYPKPPMIFRVSPDVETLWQRYQMYLDGKDRLLSMAYFCLSLLELIAGGSPASRSGQSKRRRAASNMFSIEYDVLNQLGELTSARGDRLTARKAQTTPIPLSEKERQWIEVTIKQVIRRIGEYNCGLTLPTIRMTDLPPLLP